MQTHHRRQDTVLKYTEEDIRVRDEAIRTLLQLDRAWERIANTYRKQLNRVTNLAITMTIIALIVALILLFTHPL